MRRVETALLAIGVLCSGCSSMSVGLWADSDRGQKSVAAIAAIELPADPVLPPQQEPPKKKAPAPKPAAEDEWDVPAHSKPAAASRIPSATKPVLEAADESWAPRGKDAPTSAEFGADAANYRWVQGRVSFVKIGGSRVWKLRFAPYDQVDRYGGSFVLDGTVPADLKEGDLVRVEGSPTAQQSDPRNARYKCERVTVLKQMSRPAP